MLWHRAHLGVTEHHIVYQSIENAFPCLSSSKLNMQMWISGIAGFLPFFMLKGGKDGTCSALTSHALTLSSCNPAGGGKTDTQAGVWAKRLPPKPDSALSSENLQANRQSSARCLTWSFSGETRVCCQTP